MRCAAAAGGGGVWSLTLVATSAGRPADWTVAEAQLAPTLKGARREAIERTIGEVTEAHLNTTAYSLKTVQRGLQRYRAINGKKDASKMFKSLESPDPKKMMTFFMENMRNTIKRVIDFANLLPGFADLDEEDRLTLFKQGSFEVIMTRYTQLLTSEGMFTPDMTVLIPRNLVHKMPLGQIFMEQFEFADVFNHLGLNDTETGLVCAVMIFNPDRVGLCNRGTVQKLQSLYLQCLYFYMKGQRPDDYGALFSRVIDILPLSAAVNESHAATMRELKSRGGHALGFSDLHNEVFQ